MELARDWREHLRAQYHDRLIYWSLRWASRSSLDVLTIIIDSMDQVKTAWPQYKFARKPHSLESLKRPRVILTAVLCHGWCSNVFIADEALHHGAASFCDMISRSLDNVAEIAEKNGRTFPRHLVIQADNTTAQNKNSLVSLFLAYLVSEGKFLTCTFNFLTVGHTHEDVDHFFSLILSTVLRPCRFEVPDELVALLKAKMKGFVSAKGEELYVEEVRHIRNFDDWLGQLKITLRNCFVSRSGRLAAHSFVYKCRCHLTPREVEQLPPMRRGMEEHDHDVFALTKGRMHITSFHPPVLALPRRRVEDCSLSPVPCDFKRLAEGTDAQEIIKRMGRLADTLESLPHDFSRAVAQLCNAITLSFFRFCKCFVGVDSP